MNQNQELLKGTIALERWQNIAILRAFYLQKLGSRYRFNFARADKRLSDIEFAREVAIDRIKKSKETR